MKASSRPRIARSMHSWRNAWHGYSLKQATSAKRLPETRPRSDASPREWIWVVDPIDGTAGFTDGLDTFCISVGLLRQGRPYAGAVYFPALGHRYGAVRGEGAVCDGQPIRALREEPVRDRAVLYVPAKVHRQYQITYAGKTRSLGSTALHYLLTARGVAAGAVSTAHVWDYAAAAAILEEAGGVVRHLDGSEINWLEVLDGRHLQPPVLGSSPELWGKLAETIRYLGED